jgi:anti-sigma regulatory factor (Ser/Thr protein kinase)
VCFDCVAAYSRRVRSPDGFAHEALLYRGDTGFLAGVLPFVRGGLEQDEAVVVVEPQARIDLIRDALAGDASAVQFLDMTEVGVNPARIIPLWSAAVDEHVRSGRGLRGVGEPAFAGRRAQEFAECQVHEALLDHAFDPGPAWRLLCPYDESRLPGPVRDGALRTHRTWTDARGTRVSEVFTEVSDDLDPAALAACHPLPPPTDVVLRGDFGPRDVPAVRRTVRQYARSCGLSPEQVESLELAASELASNSICHGGGRGTVAMWRDSDAAVVEFTDRGRVADPLTGRRAPLPGQDGGMGLYLVNQVCDLVQVRTGDTGTVVRVSIWQ